MSIDRVRIFVGDYIHKQRDNLLINLIFASFISMYLLYSSYVVVLQLIILN